MPADLAILIVTLKRRRMFLERLMRRLRPQLGLRVEVYTLSDEGAEKIGEKRQRLLEKATEPYVCFVDDDDLVSDDYVSCILRALDEKPDVVGFRLRYYEDGKLRGLSLHSLQCKKWETQTNNGGVHLHFRTPNHLNPVRRELALAIGYPPKNNGEDSDYSERLYKRFGQTMKEAFIDKFLYQYYYRSPQLRVEAETLAVPEIA